MATKGQVCSVCNVARDPKGEGLDHCKRRSLEAGEPGLWVVAGVIWGNVGNVLGLFCSRLGNLTLGLWVLLFSMLVIGAISLLLLIWAEQFWRFRVFQKFGMGADGLVLIIFLLGGFAMVTVVASACWGVVFPDVGLWIGAMAMILVFALWCTGELACCNCAKARGWRAYDRFGCALCKRRRGAAPAA
jgi:hypothetical protein